MPGTSYCRNRHRSSPSVHWAEFDPMDLRYHTCGGRMHVKDATMWVNIGQAAVAVVELMLFAAFYCINWSDPSMSQTFDTKFMILGVCLFAADLLFASVLYAGLRFENCGMIIADLGWMTLSAALRGLSIILLIADLIHYPGSASWLSAGLIASLVSCVIQCLSCYILARCACFIQHVRRHRRRTEALAAARLLLVQYWRPPAYRPHNPPPPYAVTTLTVPPAYEAATWNAQETSEPRASQPSEVLVPKVESR